MLECNPGIPFHNIPTMAFRNESVIVEDKKVKSLSSKKD
jgi:hypothetical protein